MAAGFWKLDSVLEFMVCIRIPHASPCYHNEIYNLMEFLGVCPIFSGLSRRTIPQYSYLLLVPQASRGLARRNFFYLCSSVFSLDGFSTPGMYDWFSSPARSSRFSGHS